MAYDNNMRGTLGKNKRKEKDSHPDYSGSAEIDGVQYWVSGWVKANGQTGEKFFSLAFKEKEDNLDRSAKAKVDASRPTPDFDDPDNDVPF
jgi:hypothetical protein